MSKMSPSFGRLICTTLILEFSLFPLSPLMADTIVLKSGEKLEAKITKTTDTTIEAEVKMSASITDIRVIQKSDIANIEQPDPAEESFAALKATGTYPNSRSVAEYDTVIHSQLNAFVGKYPTSPHVPQVKEMMANLEKEKERVAKGDVKIENIWYTPAELDKQKDQVNATLLYQQMKATAQTGDSLGALNIFSKLEKNYPVSRIYPDAVDYAVQLLPGVQNEINTKKSIMANELLERKKGMDMLPDFRKKPLMEAANAEEAKSNAALDAAIKSGVKWTPIYPRNAKSIEELQKTVTSESTRLAAVKTGPMHASLDATEDTKKKIASGDLDGATTSLQKATSLWSANPLIKDLTAELILAKATPTPTATPTPQLNKPLPAKPASKPATPATAPAAATPKAAVTTPQPEEQPAFLATIPGAVTILAVTTTIAGGISYLMKAKAKKETIG